MSNHYTPEPPPDLPLRSIEPSSSSSPLLPPLSVIVESLHTAAERHASLVTEAYTIEQHLRGAWQRLDGGWQSYAREDIETFCAHALNEATRNVTMLQQLSAALTRAQLHIEEGDADASTLFGREVFSEATRAEIASLMAEISMGGMRGLVSPRQFFRDSARSPSSAQILEGAGASEAGDAAAAAAATDGADSTAGTVDESSNQTGLGGGPGIKISTEETTAVETCADTGCLAMTVQGSGSAAPKDSVGNIVFRLGSNLPNGLELVLGSVGGMSLGKLALSMRGAEWSLPVPGTEIVHKLADGTHLHVHSEIVESGARVYTDRSGNRHMATVSGMKYVATLIALNGMVSVADSVTVRQYAWQEPRRWSFVDWFPKKPDDGREPNEWKFPDLSKLLGWPKLPLIPLWPSVLSAPVAPLLQIAPSAPDVPSMPGVPGKNHQKADA